MQRRGLALLLLAVGLAGCSGMENSIRDMNRSLYRGMGGGSDRPRLSDSTAASDRPVTPCFNAEAGLLYLSQTGRCAPGYSPVGTDMAERQFQASNSRAPVAGRGAPEITPIQPRTYQPATRGGIGSTPQANVPPGGGAAIGTITPYDSNPARVGEGVYALCYNDSSGQVFEAQACPPGSRWINTEEAQLLQRAQLTEAIWCFYADRRVLYRSRACRPGDQKLSVAEANQVWDTLPTDRRTRTRPSETPNAVQAPVPTMNPVPRSGVNATPLPAPK